jgi:imidazoleglycerol phosphate synthase glutamine amidotransferase subunit HisH
MYVLPLEIPLSRGEGWDQINWLNPATFCAYSKPETEIYFIFSFMLLLHFLVHLIDVWNQKHCTVCQIIDKL